MVPLLVLPAECTNLDRLFLPISAFASAVAAFARVRSRTVSDTERLVVGGHTAALTRLLTAHVRAPAQELLDLALVGVLLVGAPHHRRQPQMLGELDHGLPCRIAIGEARCLE